MSLRDVTILFIVCAIPSALVGQDKASSSVFDAASIKQSAHQGHGFIPAPGMLRIRAYSLKALIAVAYGVPDYEVLGGPKWLDTDDFDIVAKAKTKATTPEMLPMLCELLKQRFDLDVHREVRPVQGYWLVTDKKGTKLHGVGQGDQTPAGLDYSSGQIVAYKLSMSRLASLVGSDLRVPIVDKTGLDGLFDFKLNWVPNDTEPAPSKDDIRVAHLENAPLPAAIQEQLGLKLEAHAVDVGVIVVVRAKKPSEN